MTPDQIERVFGRGRLKMATGDHVEVFREAVRNGERRRYTKRFLATEEADFGAWTEREWRILARLIGHGILCVPDVVQFDGGAMGGMRQVQTYDAGITVDQWATLLPVSRAGVVRRSVFEDCAHWWALAHHCLAALSEIHALQLVHLDIKGDNICVPYGPPHFDPEARDTALYAVFARLALIDFAFSLVSGERLGTPLPIGWQKDYDYQSPRLLAALEAGRRGDLRPTQELDWRCDLYSLAAMLKRYLPDADEARDDRHALGWTPARYDDARALIFRLRECHDRELPAVRPHQELMDVTGGRVRERDLAESLTRGWSLARDAWVIAASTPITPLTRVVSPPQRIDVDGAIPRIVLPTAATAVVRRPRARLPDSPPLVSAALPAARTQRRWRAAGLASVIGAAAALAAPSFIGDPGHPVTDRLLQTLAAGTRAGEGEVDSRAPSPARVPARQADSSAPAIKPSAPETRVAGPAAEAGPSAATPESKPPSESTPLPAKQAPPAEERVKLAGAGPTRDAPTAGRSTSASPSRARPPSDAERPRSTNPPAASTHASIWSKASRAASARFSLHGSKPSVVAANVAKSKHAPPAEPRVQIASASQSVSEARTATGNQEKAAAQTHIASEAPTANNTAASAQSSVGDGPSPAAARSEAAPIGAGASSHAEPSIQSIPAPSTPRQRPSAQSRPGGPLAELIKIFTFRQRPAPVEERSIDSPKAVEQIKRASRAPQPQELADAAPAKRPPSQVTATIAAAPAPQVVTSPITAATFPGAKSASPTPADPPEPVPAPSLATPQVQSATPVPDVVSDQPASRVEAQTIDAESELGMRGRKLVAEVVPQLAGKAYADMYRALTMASVRPDGRQDRAVYDAIYATWPSESASIPTMSGAKLRARHLHEEAWKGYAYGRGIADVLDLELKAFGANPRDPDIAGFLAFLHLHTKPMQPETARELALHAIAVSGAQRARRIDDWNTLAVASALSGRPNDAARIFLIQVALAPNLDRSCRAALLAYADYGEPLRVPVQTMLYRVNSEPRAHEHPSCMQNRGAMLAVP